VGRTAGAVLIFWFVLHQGKMNKGKHRKMRGSNTERVQF